MAKGKVRSQSHMIDTQAIAYVKQILPEEWVAREIMPDYGIDLDVEVFAKEHEQLVTIGEHLFLQIKGTTAAKYRQKVIKYEGSALTKECLCFSLDTALLKLVERVGNSWPVLLVVVDISNNNHGFVCLNDYIDFVLSNEPTWRSQDTKNIYVPVENKLDNLNLLRLFAIRPKVNAFLAETYVLETELGYTESPERFLSIANDFAHRHLHSDVWSVISLGLQFFEKAYESIQKVVDGETDIMAKALCPDDEECYTVDTSVGVFEDVPAEIARKILTAQTMVESINNACNNFITNIRKLYILHPYEAVMRGD